VKPVNADDLPSLRGIDGLKKGSPLGVEPKGEGIVGKSGLSLGTSPEATPSADTAPSAPPKPAATAPVKSTLPPAVTGAVSLLTPTGMDTMGLLPAARPAAENVRVP
jgi:hypothetical protein